MSLAWLLLVYFGNFVLAYRNAEVNLARARFRGCLGEGAQAIDVDRPGGQVVEQVLAGPIYIDGLSTHDIRSQVLTDRRSLARDGVVAAVISTDKDTHRLAGPLKVVSSGFMDPSETLDIFQSLGDELEQALIDDPDVVFDHDAMKTKVREIASRFLYNKTHRRPMIIPVVLEIGGG